MKNERGERAMKLISDYPIYAHTSGITYEQAIGIAEALYGKTWEHELAEMERFEKLTPEEQKKELGL